MSENPLSNTTDEVEVQPWTKAFAAKDPEAFAAAFAQDVVLEASACAVRSKAATTSSR